MSQISTMSVFRFSSFKGIRHALKHMSTGHDLIKNTRGQEFYKLFGTGNGFGFSPLPDWNHFALFQIWESEADATHFLNASEFIDVYSGPSDGWWTVFLKNIQSHGEWSGNNPFIKSDTIDPANPYISSLTRATIKTKMALKFWRFASRVHKPTTEAKGLIYAKGVGTDPFTQMATFSIWRSKEDLKAFAYQTKEHEKAIKLTKETGWYKEELFARFQPYKLTRRGNIDIPEILF